MGHLHVEELPNALVSMILAVIRISHHMGQAATLEPAVSDIKKVTRRASNLMR